MTERKRWIGEVPKVCETCDAPFNGVMYDAAVAVREKPPYPWANICGSCFLFGPGFAKLGVGFGQKYVLEKDGIWYQVAGGSKSE